jgi:REP element-mobilizing transposase RayT
MGLEPEQMDQTPYELDRQRRTLVLAALREVCSHRSWTLWAAHVRTNHVHAVVEADVAPERVMHAFKAFASRGLNRQKIDGPERKRWARHGSTRWLWKDEDVQECIRYVVWGQGEQMEVYPGELL